MRIQLASVRQSSSSSRRSPRAAKPRASATSSAVADALPRGLVHVRDAGHRAAAVELAYLDHPARARGPGLGSRRPRRRILTSRDDDVVPAASLDMMLPR